MICTLSKASKHEVYVLIDKSTSLSLVTLNLDSSSRVLQNFWGLGIKRSIKDQLINHGFHHAVLTLGL